MRIAAILFTALLVAGPPALAKEESKIQTDLEVVTPGGGPPPRGSVRLKLQGSEATFHLRVKRLAASTEYVVTGEGIEQTRFTTNAKGDANEKIDLHSAAVGGLAPFDPPQSKLETSSSDVPSTAENVATSTLASFGVPFQSRKRSKTVPRPRP